MVFIKNKIFLNAVILVLILLLIVSCKPKVMTEEEMIADLSEDYGNIKVMYVVGDSMEPTFTDGQKVYVATDYYKSNEPQRDDVAAVSFKTVSTPYIKRVAFISGDTFIQSGNDFVLKDNSEKKITLSATSPLYKQLVSYKNTVPDNSVIILGDNPADSTDSRNLGLISVDKLAGKIVG